MKKVILIPAVALALLTTFQSTAQDNGPKPQGGQPQGQRPMDPHQRAQQSAEKAEKRYGLTPEQKGRWHAVAMQKGMERQQLKMQMQGETTPEQRKEIRTQAKSQNEQFDKAVKEFLTPEQFAKYTKDQQDREKKRKAAAKNKKAAKDTDMPEMEDD